MTVRVTPGYAQEVPAPPPPRPARWRAVTWLGCIALIPIGLYLGSTLPGPAGDAFRLAFGWGVFGVCVLKPAPPQPPPTTTTIPPSRKGRP